MPRESLSCTQAQSELARLKTLRAEFDVAFDEAVRTGRPERAQTLRFEIEARIRELREGLIFPLERKLNLRNQYESEKNILLGAGILETFPSGAQGIKGIDLKPYLMPSYQEVRNLIREKKAVFEKKADQGFTKLLLVPFGIKLDDLIEKYRQLLLAHYADMPDPQDPTKRVPDPQRTKLFATKEKDADPNEPLDLDTNQPVWVWDKYNGADADGTLIYDPKEFSQNHGGKTKADILKETQGKISPAWRIILVESNPNIPRATKGKDIGGRKQLEANQTPNDYLTKIGKGAYEHESGTTPEEWLTRAVSYLETTNQAIDDYQGKGSIAYNTGAYFPASDYVPDGCWGRVRRQARLGRFAPTVRLERIGARSAVRG